MFDIVPSERAERHSGSQRVLFALDVLEILSWQGTTGITEIAKTLHSDNSRVVRALISPRLSNIFGMSESAAMALVTREIAIEVRALAVPVRNSTGHVVATIL